MLCAINSGWRPGAAIRQPSEPACRGNHTAERGTRVSNGGRLAHRAGDARSGLQYREAEGGQIGTQITCTPVTAASAMYAVPLTTLQVKPVGWVSTAMP